MICSKCGKDYPELCSACWRCEKDGGDCKEHMKRIVDGIVGKRKNK